MHKLGGVVCGLLPYCWAEYEATCPQPQDRKRRRTTDFVEVNDAVYKWYCLARQTNMPVTTSTRRSLGIDADTKFKASNGLLDRFILSK